jgi:peptide deformylase
LIARVIQHEYDHIEGILFTDKISVIEKRLISKKAKKISIEGNIPRVSHEISAKGR